MFFNYKVQSFTYVFYVRVHLFKFINCLESCSIFFNEAFFIFEGFYFFKIKYSSYSLMKVLFKVALLCFIN